MKFFFPLILFFSCCIGCLSAQNSDTIPPVIKTKNIGFLTWNCYDTLRLSHVVDTVYDDHSSEANIQVGMRIGCTGQDEPLGRDKIFVKVSTYFEIEILAKDEAGNVASTIKPVYINAPGCDHGHSMMARSVFQSDSFPYQGLHHVDFHAFATNCTGDTLSVNFNSGYEGMYNSQGPVFSTGQNGTIRAVKSNDPLNGVTTHDIMLISRHILGLEPFDSPYELIAADANMDGKVTIFDMVLLRKLILGIIDELPHGNSWRFWLADYTFPNPANPFSPPFPESYFIPNGEEATVLPYFFEGVKIGDVDFSADPNQ